MTAGLFLALAAVHIALIVYLDNTNLGTANGLWKAPMVLAWERGAGRPMDTGDLLYLPVYGFLCRLIPDRAVSYGVRGEIVVFRKMTMLNALFSALASCGVFILALRFLSSLFAALVVTLAHAAAGFVLLHSVNSEDVTPAYAFFVLTVLFFFEFVRTRKRSWLVLCAAFLALTTFFHWTLMAPALAALAVIQVALVVKGKHTAWLPATFTLLFLGFIGLGTLLVRLLYPDLSYSLLQVLYPAKAHPDGYAGITWNKLGCVLIGIGNYFSGAHNLADVRALSDLTLVKPMIVSWLYCGLAVGACAVTLLGRSLNSHLRLLAGFCLVLFGMGEAEAFYVLPNDPQWHMAPMFISIAGLIILFRCLRSRLPARTFRTVAAGLALAFLVNGLWTLRDMAASRGSDSRDVAIVQGLARMFPPANFAIVSHSFEGWKAWWYVESCRGNWDTLSRTEVGLATPLITVRGISAAAAAEMVKRRIGEEFAAGRRVVACSLWVQKPEDFVGWMTALANREMARAYYDALYTSFRLGRRWDTPVGPFVELLPGKDVEHEATGKRGS